VVYGIIIEELKRGVVLSIRLGQRQRKLRTKLGGKGKEKGGKDLARHHKSRTLEGGGTTVDEGKWKGSTSYYDQNMGN